MPANGIKEVPDREVRRICTGIAEGSTEQRFFGEFAKKMGSRTFRTRASAIIEDYRNKGGKVESRGIVGCFKTPNPMTGEEKAANLQAAWNRVMRGGLQDLDGPYGPFGPDNRPINPRVAGAAQTPQAAQARAAEHSDHIAVQDASGAVHLVPQGPSSRKGGAPGQRNNR